VASAFRAITKVEIEHENRYSKLISNVENGEVFKRSTKVRWKCRNCGFVFEGLEAPEKCPACLHPKAYFEIKETTY
jgi:rubrerythrin